MSIHDLSAEGFATRLEQVARRALAEYDVSPDADLTLWCCGPTRAYFEPRG